MKEKGDLNPTTLEYLEARSRQIERGSTSHRRPEKKAKNMGKLYNPEIKLIPGNKLAINTQYNHLTKLLTHILSDH